jgi:charged multivesicular body protein 5
MKVLQRRKMYETQKDQLEQQSWNMQQAGMMQDNLKSLSTFSLVSICWLLPLLLPWQGAGKGAVAVGLGLLAWTMLMRGLRRWRGADVMVTVDAMKTTNKELKKQYGKVNIDKSKLVHSALRLRGWATNGLIVDQMQDEMADLMDIGNDIQESISRSYDIPDGNSCRHNV